MKTFLYCNSCIAQTLTNLIRTLKQTNMKNLEMNLSTWEDLKSDLKNQFPSLNDEDFLDMDHSVLSLISGLSLKVNLTEEEVATIVEDKVEEIKSKKIT